MRKAIYIMILVACIFAICLPHQTEGIEKKQVRELANPGYQLIPEAKFREIFKDYLCHRLSKAQSDVIISRFKVLGNRPIPRGKAHFQLYQKDTRRLKGYMRLVVLISVNGVVKNEVRLSGWVDVFEPVVCTSRKLKKGETIKKDDIYIERKNTSHLSTDIITDMNKIMGLIVKHTLQEGTCLKEWMLEKSPIVDRGDMVTILAESGDIRVTVPGMVLERGYVGELVRVQNAMSKKEIHARVINNSTVMVHF